MLYVIKVKDYSYYKIGITQNIKLRFKELQRVNPFELEIYREIYKEGSLYLEIDLHKIFNGKKIRNEWFDLNETDIKLLDKHIADYVPKVGRNKIKSIVNKNKTNYVSLIHTIIELEQKYRIGQGKSHYSKENGMGGDTLQIVGNELKISTKNIRRLKKIYHTNPELLQEIDKGNMSINSAYHSILL